MAGRPRTKPRADIGTKRRNYTVKQDTRGKTHKENHLIKGFWSVHKMEDMIQLTPEQISAEIALWIEEFEETQRKRNMGWQWPTYLYDPNPTPKAKGPKKINKSFNSSFVQKKMIQ